MCLARRLIRVEAAAGSISGLTRGGGRKRRIVDGSTLQHVATRVVCVYLCNVCVYLCSCVSKMRTPSFQASARPYIPALLISRDIEKLDALAVSWKYSVIGSFDHKDKNDLTRKSAFNR